MNDKVATLLKPRSDLGKRTLSSVAMMTVAIVAIWLGGFTFMGLVVAIGLGVFFEFTKLVFGFAQSRQAQIFWLLGGLTYVGLACFTLMLFSAPFFGMTPAIMLIAGVIGTDVGAYFAGRSIGGLFDRTDGLIAVAFAAGVVTLFQSVVGS